MRRTLRKKSLPEDLVWVSMIESGFQQVAWSSAGAPGLWPFMPDTARIYGLTVDRWLDQRFSPQRETDAAADFLADPHRRYGSWELALAAYDMGYGGLSSVVRRYNTNDFWSLARTEGTLPWETTLYVPKILAAAVVAHNLGTFGFSDLVVDPPVESDEVTVPAGTPLSVVAQAVGSTTKELEAYNPELRAARTPPAGEGDAAYAVKVPVGKGGSTSQALSRTAAQGPGAARSVRGPLRRDAGADRHGPQDDDAEARGAERDRAGRGRPRRHRAARPRDRRRRGRAHHRSHRAPGKQSVVVPADVFVYPDRRRVFYRVQIGDTLKEIASALHVGVDDLDRWNDIDPGARLEEGMTLQAYVLQDTDLSRVMVVPESDVHVMAGRVRGALRVARAGPQHPPRRRDGAHRGHAGVHRQALRRPREDDGAGEPARAGRRAHPGRDRRRVRAGERRTGWRPGRRRRTARCPTAPLRYGADPGPLAGPLTCFVNAKTVNVLDIAQRSR